MMITKIGSKVTIGADFVDCVTGKDGWRFSMLQPIGMNAKMLTIEILVLGVERTMDEAEKIVRAILKAEGITLAGLAAQRT
jgi:hypothetical protein